MILEFLNWLPGRKKKMMGDFITLLDKLMTCYVGGVIGGIGTLLT